MDIHVFLHESHDDAVKQKLDQIITRLVRMEGKEDLMAGEVQALTDQVAANTSVEDSAVVLLNNIHAALVAAGTDPVKLAALKDTLKTHGDALAAAVVANTDSAPPAP